MPSPPSPPAVSLAVPPPGTVSPGRVRDLAAHRPLLLIGAGCFFYATGPVFVAGSSVSGPVFSFWRLWFGVAVFGALALAHRRATGRRPSRRAWVWAAVTGAIFGVDQLLFMTAVKETSVVDVLLVGTLGPLITAIAAVPMFGERTGRAFRVWTLVAIAGSAVVLLAGSTGPEGRPLGMLLAVLDVFAFTAFFMFSKVGRDHGDTVPFLFGVMCVATVVVSSYVVLTGGAVRSATGDDLLLALATAVIPGTFGHFVSTWPLKWVPANVPPVMRLSIPFLSGFMAWLFLGQGIEAGHVVGGAVTVGGVAGALLSPAGRRLIARRPVTTVDVGAG